MMLRVAQWVIYMALTGAGGILGTAAAAVGTDAGRAALIEFGLGLANRSIRGTVAVGSSDGAPLEGLTLYDVSVRDTAGHPLLTIGSASVSYSVRDLLSGRIVLGNLRLDRPVVSLRQRGDGTWNVAEVFRLGDEDEGGGGPNPLIAFRDVRLDSGVVTIDGATSRTIAIQSATLPYLRLSSPLPGQGTIRVEVGTAHVTLSNPAVRVADLRGAVAIDGDSLQFDLSALRLANSEAAVEGWLRPGNETTFDLRVDASRLDVIDLAAFTRGLPQGVRSAVGSANVRLARRAPGSLTVEADRVALTPGDGGSVSGRVAVSLGPQGQWSLADTDIRTERMSLDVLTALLDSIPLDGRLTGRTRASGRAESLAVHLDWQFTDAAVAGAPVTSIVGDGTVALGGDEGLRFIEFGLTRAGIALASVRRLVPAVELQGRADGAGTLGGPWRRVTFSGTVRHRHDTLPATTARGVITLDTRTDTVAVDADLAFDSLATDGLRPSYPAVALAGSYAGDVRVSGPLTSFRLDVTLAGPRGAFTGGGRVSLDDQRRGVDSLDLTFRDATVDALQDRFPDTRLTGRARGSVWADSTLTATDLTVSLRPSALAAVPLDSLYAHVRTARSRLLLDSVAVWSDNLAAHGRGGLGLTDAVRDSLTLVLEVESIADLLPLAIRYRGEESREWVPDSLDGAFTLTVIAAGHLGAVDLSLSAEVSDARWDRFAVPEATASWRRTVRGDTRVRVRADSVGVGDLGFGSVTLDLAGDSVRQPFVGRARLGDYAALLVGGALEPAPGRVGVHLDSLAVLAGQSVWFLERPGTIAVTDSFVHFDSLSLAPPTATGRLAIAGTLPRMGPGALEVEVESMRLGEVWALLQHDPDLASGELSGSLALGGTARAPVVEATLALREGVFGEFRAPYVETTTSYRDRRLTGLVRLFRLGDEILTVEVGLPMNLGLRDVTQRRLPGDLTIRATANGVDLALLDAISPAVRRTTGRFSADFGITGSWERPQLTGFISIADGAASFPALGVRHERLNGRVSLAGDSILIDQLSIASGAGTAEIGGSIRLEELTRARLALSIRATDFRAIEVPDFLSATVSGDIQLNGPLFHATLTGRGTIPRGVIWFADIVEKDIINLEDTLYASFVDRELLRREGLGAEFENRFLDSLTIENLQLSMGNDVWLRSGEANIQLTGNLTVGKIAQQYRVDGTLVTPRGTYRLQLFPQAEGFEREFEVTRGQVQYFGTDDLDAALDVDARHVVRTRRGRNVTVFVHIGGTVYSPTLTLSSDHRPPLSDTEIISYLLVGAPSVAAAGVEGGLHIGQGFVDAIASRFTGQIGQVISDLGVPIDYFEVRPQLDVFGGGFQGAQVSVGRRISDRVFVTVNPRICPNNLWELYNLGFGVEYRLSQAFRLAAGAEPLGSCRLLGVDQTTLRYQLGLDLLWETTY